MVNGSGPRVGSKKVELETRDFKVNGVDTYERIYKDRGELRIVWVRNPSEKLEINGKGNASFTRRFYVDPGLSKEASDTLVEQARKSIGVEYCKYWGLVELEWKGEENE